MRRSDAGVVVIGGAGYVGSALVRRLLARGRRVRVVDRLLYGRQALESVLGHGGLELIESDFGDTGELAAALEGSEAVVHLAAIVGDSACDLAPGLAARVNVASTSALVEAIRSAAPRRFVFASTCAVYRASRQLLDERSATEPLSLYARTKLAGEQAVLALPGERTAPTVLRFASLYGLSARWRFDLVVNRFAAQACAHRRIAVHGGAQRRPFLHVEDAARAIEAVLDADPAAVARRILNAGSENLAIGRVAELVARAIPGTTVAVEQGGLGAHDYRVSSAELGRRTGFVPIWTVRRGIRQLVRALRSGAVAEPEAALHDNAAFLRHRSEPASVRPGMTS